MTEDVQAIRRLFRDVPMCRVATVRPDGGPHVAPRWFVWLDDAIWVATRVGDTTWEDAGGRFTVGTALEVEALHEAGIEQADVVVCSTDGDNTNIIVAQLAKKRFQVPKVVVRVLDPYRAEWYSEQGLQTVCPTQVAIDMLTEAVMGDADVVAGEAG